MTSLLLLTPASVGYLTQFCLALLMGGYLAFRSREQKTDKRGTILLALIFLIMTVFIALMFFDTASMSFQSFVIYFENTTLAIFFFLLIGFALFCFGGLDATGKIIAYSLLGLNALYVLHEIVVLIERSSSLLFDGMVTYRPAESDYYLAIIFALIPLTFAIQVIRLDKRSVPWTHKLLHTQGEKARSAKLFALTFFITFPLAISNILRSDSLISTTIYNIISSLGILIGLWLFFDASLLYIPGRTSFLVRLSAISLTVVFAVLGASSWVIMLPFSRSYQPGLMEKQALRFTPNRLGGYDIREIPFQFEHHLGEKLAVTSRGSGRNQRVQFHFPFYGKEYEDIYITSVGAIVIGQSLYHPNLQYRYGSFPAIYPLLIDLEPDKGGVYALVEPYRLVATWKEIPALHNPSAYFTFQTILYADGSFEIAYEEIPDVPLFKANSSASANPWIRGVTPGLQEAVTLSKDFSPPLDSGPQGIIQDFHLEFRQRQHQFLFPVAWLIVTSSVIIIFGLPIIIRRFFLQPLQVLLSGVEQVRAGNLLVQMPIESDDEIGFVTSAFNEMTKQVSYLVNHLEELVTERTHQLQISNQRLQLEIREREATQEMLMLQQRSLVIAEEREQISRDLHDGLGQLLGYINVQAQAVKVLLQKNELETAQNNLNLLIESAQQTHTELRQHILGMRNHGENRQNFHATLQRYLNDFSKAWGIETKFNTQKDWMRLAETTEDQLLHIVREALANIRKHAHASRVEISTKWEESAIVLTIADDGIGFNLLESPGEQQNHYGLNIMRERAEQFGGLLQIISSPGKGTKVVIQIPCLPKEEAEPESVPLGALRLLLVDDHPIFLNGFRNLLAARGLTVVGTASNGLEAFEQVEHLHPDVVLMDVHMPLCDGIQATRIIKAEFPQTRVILLTVSEEEENLLRAIKYGASGYLLKNMDIGETIQMIYDAVSGSIQISSSIARQLLAEIDPPEADPQPAAETALPEALPPQLTPRQWEVLRLVASGLTYKEVGKELGLTERTIKYHMTQILQNLQLKNRTQGVRYAQKFQEDKEKPVN